MTAGDTLAAIRRGEATLGAALDALVREIDGQLTGAERTALAGMLDAWPRAPDGTAERPEALREGLSALLTQAQAARGVDAFEALKPAAKAGAFGLFSGTVVTMVLDVALFGRAWAGPPALAWALTGTPTLLFAALGYRQARRPTRLTRALLHGLLALPAGGFAAAMLWMVAMIALEELLPEATSYEAVPLLLGSLLGVTLAAGIATAAWAMRRAWRRWDEVRS